MHSGLSKVGFGPIDRAAQSRCVTDMTPDLRSKKSTHRKWMYGILAGPIAGLSFFSKGMSLGKKAHKT